MTINEEKFWRQLPAREQLKHFMSLIDKKMPTKRAGNDSKTKTQNPSVIMEIVDMDNPYSENIDRPTLVIRVNSGKPKVTLRIIKNILMSRGAKMETLTGEKDSDLIIHAYYDVISREEVRSSVELGDIGENGKEEL